MLCESIHTILKNNLSAILSHVAIVVIMAYILNSIESGSAGITIRKIPIFDKIEGYRNLLIVMNIIAIFLYLFSTLLLKNSGNSFYNCASVISVSIILAFLWILAEVFQVLDKGYYSIVFNTPFFPIYYLFEGNKWIGLILSLMPSTLMWLGLEFKNKIL